MNDEKQTPLTLQFKPERLEGDDKSAPIVVAEPSFLHDGRIFVGVHPRGDMREGCHLLPEDAMRLYRHLGMLLMVPLPDEDELPARQPKRRWLSHFRFEFSIGRLHCVMGTSVE